MLKPCFIFYCNLFHKSILLIHKIIFTELFIVCAKIAATLKIVAGIVTQRKDGVSCYLLNSYELMKLYQQYTVRPLHYVKFSVYFVTNFPSESN